MSFVSLDFETANPSRVSICAAGLAVFEDGKLKESPYWLVRPPEGHGHFWPRFIECHGLTHLDVLNVQEFPAIAPELLARLTRADIVIAHNAAFDIDHLRQTLNHFSLPYPEFDYICTCQLAGRVWPELPSHSLDALAAHIGHDFHHHNAQSDAEAAGRVLLAMMKDAGANTPSELLQKVGIVPRHFSNLLDVSRREWHKPPNHMSLPLTNAENQPTAADYSELLQLIKPLAEEYEENLEKNRKIDIGFNLFELVSDHYYRETFHSDIINALLDPKDKHKEQDKFLKLFLKFLREQHSVNINFAHYEKAEVAKEEGKIDILIKGHLSNPKRAIIIENKINGAGDMNRQLPRYLENVKAEGYICDAIIYLRLNADTGPDMRGWNDNDRKAVEPLLKIICAYDGTENEMDLRNGWILKCANESNNNPNAQHILRQYADIVRKLGTNTMNKPILAEFYDIITKSGNFETALSMKKMLDELIPYRLERIIDQFKNASSPFRRLIRYSDGAIFQDPNFEWADFEMAVWALPDSYLFDVYDRSDSEGTEGRAKVMLTAMGCNDNYIPIPDKKGHFKFNPDFKFPSEEQKLIPHIMDFLTRLSEAIKSESRR